MIIITGTVLLKDDARESAIALGLDHSKRSRAEPGCISHDCYIAADNPNRMHFFEQWADMEAVGLHFAMPDSNEFIRAISDLAASKPETAIYSAEAMQQTPF